jgi:hypothetical protein
MPRYWSLIGVAAIVLVLCSSTPIATASPTLVTAREHVTLTLALLRNPYPIFNQAAPRVIRSSTLTEVGTKMLVAATQSKEFTTAEKLEIRAALGVLRAETRPRTTLVDFLANSTPVLFPSGTTHLPLSSRVDLLATRFDVLGKRSGTNPAYASEAFDAASDIVKTGATSLYSTNNPFAAKFYSAVAKKGGWGRKIGGSALTAFLLFLASADASGGLLGAANVVPIQKSYVPPDRCTKLSVRCGKKLVSHVAAHALASSWGALFGAACLSGRTSKDQKQCPATTEKAR